MQGKTLQNSKTASSLWQLWTVIDLWLCSALSGFWKWPTVKLEALFKNFNKSPIVDIKVVLKASSENLNSRHVFPTPESPINNNLKSKSYVFFAISNFCVSSSSNMAALHPKLKCPKFPGSISPLNNEFLSLNLSLINLWDNPFVSTYKDFWITHLKGVFIHFSMQEFGHCCFWYMTHFRIRAPAKPDVSFSRQQEHPHQCQGTHRLHDSV